MAKPSCRYFGTTLILACVLVSSCARDIYQQRAEVVKGHTESFYRNLQDDRVAGAIAENEQIEGLAREMERGLVRRATSMDTNQKAREWALIKTTNQTAIDNWLNLGRYLSQTKRYDQARGAYQRVVETYQGKGSEYGPFIERARMGLKDVDLMLMPPTIP